MSQVGIPDSAVRITAFRKQITRIMTAHSCRAGWLTYLVRWRPLRQIDQDSFNKRLQRALKKSVAVQALSYKSNTIERLNTATCLVATPFLINVFFTQPARPSVSTRGLV